MRKIAILLFLFLFSEVQPSLGTHIVGGELYYRYLGNNNYQIHLRVYRDCFYGVPPFDQPASVGIFNANNVLVQQLFMNVNDSSTVPPIINSPCFIPPTNVCYRVANYYATVNLPFSPGGYQLAYQRCCRNQTILNVVSPLTTGATFYANIPASQPINSNPVFDSLPPPFVCAGLPLVFDHSATDADGDSLVYEICNPYDGATQNNPQPQPPFNPPYANVVWNPPYNLSNLLGGIPMTIDPQTGLLTATPNTIGQFVIGVCVNEYRNGVLLSKTRRDYQLNVVPCPSLVVAALQSPSLQCGSPTVQFTNNSFGAGSYFWNFGDPGTLADTSLQVNPSYTYADTGLYNVTLIAYSAFNPGCADTTVGQIQILPDYEIDFTYSFNPCSYTVSFNDTSNTASGPTVQWNWNFGDGGSATTTDPTHTFAGPGTYSVSLTAVSSRGCTEKLTKTVVIPPFISAQINATGTSCHDSCDATATVSIANGNDPFTYLWNDPQSQDSSTAVGLCPGSYQVSITDSNGCTTTAQVTINAPAPVSLSLSSTDAYCNGACIGTASALPSGGTPPYFYSWNDPQSQNTSVADGLCEGWYTVNMTDVNGCPVSDSVYVQFSNFIPALDATASADTIFAGQTINLNALTSGGPFSYSWTPPDSVNNPQLQNPTSSPTQPITYYVTIEDSNGCENLDSVTVFVKEVFCEEPEIFIPNAFSPDGNGKNDKLYVRGNTMRELTLKIFDRWGELVFETNDPSIGWDGTYKGKLSAPAVYVYWLEATCYNEEKFFKKGNITLIR